MVITFSMRTPVSSCLQFEQASEAAATRPQTSTSESATSPITMARRIRACAPDEPRADRFKRLRQIAERSLHRRQRTGKQRHTERHGAGKCKHPYVQRHVGSERERIRQQRRRDADQQVGDARCPRRLPADTAPGSR